MHVNLLRLSRKRRYVSLYDVSWVFFLKHIYSCSLLPPRAHRFRSLLHLPTTQVVGYLPSRKKCGYFNWHSKLPIEPKLPQGNPSHTPLPRHSRVLFPTGSPLTEDKTLSMHLLERNTGGAPQTQGLLPSQLALHSISMLYLL